MNACKRRCNLVCYSTLDPRLPLCELKAVCSNRCFTVDVELASVLRQAVQTASLLAAYDLLSSTALTQPATN